MPVAAEAIATLANGENLAGNPLKGLPLPATTAPALPVRDALSAVRSLLDDSQPTSSPTGRYIGASTPSNAQCRRRRAQTEFDALVDLLTAAIGHGGKTRRAGDTVEKARSAVTHRVRSTIRLLHKLHEPLARHLHRSISTGNYCSYQPHQPITWDIRL